MSCLLQGIGPRIDVLPAGDTLRQPRKPVQEATAGSAETFKYSPPLVWVMPFFGSRLASVLIYTEFSHLCYKP